MRALRAGKRLSALLVVLAALLLMGACAGAEPTATPSPTPTSAVAPAATPTPTPRGTPTPTPTIRVVLVATPTPTPTTAAPVVVKASGRVVITMEPPTTGLIDPAQSRGNTDQAFMWAIYNCTVGGADERMALAPGIATKWEMSGDGKTWTYTIRKDVKFHDGTLVRPEDIKFTVENYVKLKSYRAPVYTELVESIETKGDDTVIVHMKKQDVFLPYWMSDLDTSGHCGIVPKAYKERVGDAAFSKKPVGTGPFKPVSHAAQEYLEVTAFPEHFKNAPRIESARFVIVGEETTRMAQLKVGEADAAQLSTRQLAALQKDAKLRPIMVPEVGTVSLKYWGLDMPESENPLVNKKVRMALDFAVDRQAIADAVYSGAAEPAVVAYGAWPSDPVYLRDLKPYPYDPERARALLKEAGYPNLSLKLHGVDYGPTPLMPEVAEVVAAQWQAIGVKVELRRWEWAGYAPKARAGEFRGQVSTHMATHPAFQERSVADKVSRPGTTYGEQIGAWALFPVFEEWSARMQEDPDPKVRAELAEKAMRLVYDEHIFNPIVHTSGIWGLSSRVKAWTPRAGQGPFINLWTVEVSK
ncbi:MAG: ABC transporter substrate-binding protein [Chloroflexi bacterium]|nr:ABC transporter substrate-binding protein [Chloroflexota bacterium]